jgi:hypothetical protein
MCHIPITHWASVNVITWKFRRPSACRSSHENFTTKDPHSNNMTPRAHMMRNEIV